MRALVIGIIVIAAVVTSAAQPCQRGPVADTTDAWRSTLLLRTLDSIATFARPETVFMLTADGRTALIVGPYGPRGVRRLAVARRSTPASPFTAYEPIAIDAVDRSSIPVDATMTDDARTLVVALEQSSGVGDLDLYVTHRCYDRWSTPQPLGGTINTKSMEGAPTLAKDGRTLYFVSNGRADTRGKADLYMVRRLGDGWTSWTEPVHLGACVNTTDDELGMELIGDGTRAMVSTYDPQRSGPGLTVVPLPASGWPLPYCLFTGTVSNAVTDAVMPGMTIAIDDSTDRRPCGPSTYVAGPDGTFAIPLPMRATYTIRPTRDGYAVADNVLRIRRLDSISPLRMNLRVFDMRTPLASVVVDRETGRLDERQMDVLRALVRRMGMRAIGFHVVGHLDDRGPMRGSGAIADRRARAVRDALRGLGIDDARLSVATRSVEMPVLVWSMKEHPLTRRVDVYAMPPSTPSDAVITAPSR